MSAMSQISLGTLIEMLKYRPAEQSVVFDFGGFYPTTVDSYRGFYGHSAIGFSGPRTYEEEQTSCSQPQPTVGDVARELTSAIGRTFTGWKGGDFMMRESTPLWVANPGRGSSTAVTGIGDCEYQTVITTEYYE